MLRRLGAVPGARIGLLLPNSPAVLVYTFAAFAIGASVAALDPDGSEDALAEFALASGFTLLITCDLVPLLEKALALGRRGRIQSITVISYGSMLSASSALRLRLFAANRLSRLPVGFVCPVRWERDVAQDKSREAVTAPERRQPASSMSEPPMEDTALMCWTRVGGVSRLVSLTQANLTNNLNQICSALPQLEPGRDRIVAALPLWHPLSLALTASIAVSQGSELTIVPELESDALIEAVKGSRPTILMAPAPLLAAFLTHPRLGNMPSLRLVLVTGGTITPALSAAMAAVSNALLLECYAPSSTPAVVAITHLKEASETANLQLVGETRVSVHDLADPSRELPRGERGEVYVSGAQIAGTQQVEPRQGIFVGNELRTGELGLIDAAGRLLIVDHVEDLIVAAGYLIYPRRIETALLEHPGVTDAAVIGIGDGKRGNAPKAFVVLKRGLAITERDLRLFLASRISKIEMPADIDFTTALPRTPFGLVCKVTLRRLEAARRT